MPLGDQAQASVLCPITKRVCPEPQLYGWVLVIFVFVEVLCSELPDRGI